MIQPSRILRGKDHFLSVLPADIEPVQNALVLDRLSTFFLFTLNPADEIVGGAVGKILQRLDVVLTERATIIAVVTPETLVSSSATPSCLRRLIAFLLDTIEEFARPRLNFCGRIFVKALDAGDFLESRRRPPPRRW